MNIKKILLGLLVAVVVAGGGVAWMARQQFAKNLALFATPQTVRFGAVDVALPALHGNVSGVLEPTAALGDVDVKIQIAGHEAPVTLRLKNAAISARPFALDLTLKSDVATLETVMLPAAQTFDRVVLTVRPPSTLTRFAIGETTLAMPGDTTTDSKSAKHATLRDLELALVPTPSYVPEELRVKLGGLEIAKSATNVVAMKGLELAFLAKAGTDRRTTTSKFAWEEISVKSDEVNVFIKPFTSEARGSIKEHTADEVAAKASELKDAFLAVSVEPNEATARAAVQSFFHFLVFFEPGSDSATAEWQGLAIDSLKDHTKVVMAPCRVAMHSHEHPYAANYDLGCESFEVTPPDGEVVAKQMSFKGDAQYPFQTAQEALVWFQDFYGNAATPSLSTVLRMVVGYPSHMAGALGVQDIHWKKGANVGQLHNVGYDLSLDDKGSGATFHGEVAKMTVPEDWHWPVAELTNASLRSHFGILVPWNELQTRLGALLKAPKVEVVALVKQSLVDWGLNIALDVKGGNLGFDSSAVATLNTKLDQWELPPSLAQAFAAVSGPEDPALKSAFEKLTAAVTPHVLSKGMLDITLDVNKLSALKTFINKMNPGTAELGLAGAKSFIVVDDAKDTLKSHLQVHDGHVEVNGAPQPMLDSMLQQLRSGSGDASAKSSYVPDENTDDVNEAE